MKKILLVIPYGTIGGMERLALTFYHHYVRLGYDVKVVKIIALKNDIIHFGEDEIAISSKDFWEYRYMEKVKLYLSIPFKLRRLIKKNKIDYTISFGDLANCVSGLTRTREFKIASIHALKSIELTEPSTINQFFKFAYKSVYRRFNKVVCISEGIKDDLKFKLNYKFDNLEVIYNPHNIEYIETQSREPLTTAEHKLFCNNKVVLFLGRLCNQKSPWHLIKAFSISDDSATKLVFVGDGDINVENYCKQLVGELGLQERVFFLGRKANPYKYLRYAKVLALSSQYEGTPNVIAEAIVLNIPIVSSNCTEGIVEMMGLNKPSEEGQLLVTESGIITPNLYRGSLSIPTSLEITEDEISIAQALNIVISDHERFVFSLERSRERLLEKFNLSSVCYNYLGPSRKQGHSKKARQLDEQIYSD